MDQKHLSQSSVTTHVFDALRAQIGASYTLIGDLEQRILSSCWDVLGASYRPDSQDFAIARRYFYFYTVPLLDIAGLLQQSNLEQGVFWGTAQLCLGLHLRYIDYVIDQDIEGASRLAALRRSYLYLAHVQELLHRRSLPWSAEARALYMQFLDYESDVQRGYMHDLGTIWRRVSPLCVVGECYLQEMMHDSQVLRYYRLFLGWSLVQADCDDVLKDLTANRETPVTRLVQEQNSATFHFSLAIGATITAIKEQLSAQMVRLYTAIAESYPIWGIVLRSLDELFAHRE